MVMEKEDSASLAEALEQLKTTNKTWNPKGFVVDSSEMEMSVIRTSFKGVF